MKKMLVSHFKIGADDDPEEEEKVVVKQKKKKQKKIVTSEAEPEENLSEEADVEEPYYFPEHEAEPEIIPEVVYPTRALNAELVSGRLSMLGRTGEGDGFAYLKISCTGMKLTNVLAIKRYTQLQFVDVSDNNLDLQGLQPITELPFLILLHADKNVLRSAALKKCKYLQVLILNGNRLTSVHDVFQTQLSTLEVGNNKIQRLHFDNRMPLLRCLDFRNNIINDISNINFVNLESLYLAGNKIKSLVGIERLVNLKILHMRFNPLKLLDGLDAACAKLQYVNFRNCKIKSLFQIKKLRVLPSLEILVIKGCPYMGGTGEEGPDTAEDDPDSRVEVLAALPSLKRLNKGEPSPEEREQAKELMKQWEEEGEADADEEGEEAEPEQE